MIDLTPTITRAQIIYSVIIIVLALFYYFFVKTPSRDRK